MHTALAFALAALTSYLLTPLAIRIAGRTGFVDKPAGYKGHRQPTPYLGGCAITLGALAGAAVGTIPPGYAVVIGCVVGVWILGTVDDRISLPILLRVAAELGIAIALTASGLHWDIFHNTFVDSAVSVVWIIGLMNAFNLMDNMDGATATVAAASAVGVGTLALVAGHLGTTPLCFATAGACIGFLPRNLANPARIFMGDGGSLPLGLLVAVTTMTAVNSNYLGPSGVVIGALLVGMVILDTTLVTISRSRAGRPVLSGGRDHLTHRLVKRLGSPRRVALTLAVTQLLVCGVTISVAQAGAGWVLLAGGFGIIAAAALIWQFESSPAFKPEPDHADPPAEPVRIAAAPPEAPVLLPLR
jgi:UDP-GlcNAc:undecaprenyl-phosphate/decaprenyl-phosphate GlcNAc-1-phosphate transferase